MVINITVLLELNSSALVCAYNPSVYKTKSKCKASLIVVRSRHCTFVLNYNYL